MLASSYHLRTLFVCLLTMILFSESCKKTMQPAPAPSASVTGVVNPARAALQVIAVRDAQNYTSVPDVYGKFTFQNLAPGTYSVYAMPDSGFSAPAPTAITLQNGQQTDIGTITMSQNVAATATLYITCVPPGAATTVKAINQASHVITTIQPQNVSTSSSSFTIAVPAGTYTVSVIAAPEFQAPSDTTVNLIAGRTYAFPTITLLPVTVTNGGQVSGTLAPTGIATKITIVKSNSPLQYSVTPDAAGKFSFANVAPGTYSLSGTVTFGSGYLAPALSNIVVNPNQRVDLGTISLLPDTRVFSYYVNDTIYRKASFYAGSLASSRLTVTGSIGYINSSSMDLTIEGFNGPGQYLCSTTTGTKIQYTEPYNSGFDTYNTTLAWSSNNPGGSGTITVTDYNPAAKKISGTFLGTVQSSITTGIYTGKSTKKISKGVFTDIVYQ